MLYEYERVKVHSINKYRPQVDVRFPSLRFIFEKLRANAVLPVWTLVQVRKLDCFILTWISTLWLSTVSFQFECLEKFMCFEREILLTFYFYWCNKPSYIVPATSQHVHDTPPLFLLLQHEA